MIEKALLIVFVVLGLIVALQSIAGRFNDISAKVGCGIDNAKICVIDGKHV